MPAPILSAELYANRELSNIEFNRRVLAQAQDESLPLLERVKFLAIFSNNMDEFFMVRIASYLQKIKLGIATTRPDGLTPAQVMTEVRRRTLELVALQRDIMRDLFAKLEQADVCIKPLHELHPIQREALRTMFQEEIFPVLTPLAVDHSRPFPFISNLSLNLGVFLRHQGASSDNDLEFARLKVPEFLPRLINVGQVLRKYAPQGVGAERCQYTFIWVEELIADNLDMLFAGMTVVEQHPFRITRNADIDYEHELEDGEELDVSEWIEESVRMRRFGFVVRLSVPEEISPRMLSRLINELEVDAERDVYMIEGALGASSLFELASIDRPDLKDPAYLARVVTPSNGGLFAAIRAGDILVHHPYDSFMSVEQFFLAAAHDPDVLAIKATLYRVGKNSPVVQALMEARDNDKQVAVLVELKARFDEENNLEWARALERKGVHVTYGVEELKIKTHAKVSLVVRREPDGVRRYVHLGTGNYNASTARIYTDLGIFTCNREIADDATRLFNRLTGFAPATSYKRLLVAPDYLRLELLRLIELETAAAQAGKPARIIFKMNQLEEDTVMQKLYEASQAGVKVDLIVRGLCCLRPGIPGFSDNIRVISIIGRFLEHSRIYYFQNAPVERRLYMGSADIMRRNLYNRVEVVFPVLDERLQRKALRILATQLRDNVGAWGLQPDDRYVRIQRDENDPMINSQALFMSDSYGLDILP